MIKFLMLAQAATVPAQGKADLSELTAIVEPYAKCEFANRLEFEALQSEWSVAARRQYAEPSDKAAAAKAGALMKNLIALKRNIEAKCGYERIHQQLRERLLSLHPKVDEARAFWMARSVFHTLNNLNESIVKVEAGVFPPNPTAPPAPPAPPSPPRLPNAQN